MLLVPGVWRNWAMLVDESCISHHVEVVKTSIDKWPAPFREPSVQTSLRNVTRKKEAALRRAQELSLDVFHIFDTLQTRPGFQHRHTSETEFHFPTPTPPQPARWDAQRQDRPRRYPTSSRARASRGYDGTARSAKRRVAMPTPSSTFEPLLFVFATWVC